MKLTIPFALLAIVIGTVGLTRNAEARKKPKGAVMAADLVAMVHAVADAARKRDFKALREAMTKDFTYSFGGDNDADQALEEWSKEARSLRQMDLVLRMPCRHTTPKEIECPGRGGLAFRAGFSKEVDGWKLSYFVEGD